MPAEKPTVLFVVRKDDPAAAPRKLVDVIAEALKDRDGDWWSLPAVSRFLNKSWQGPAGEGMAKLVAGQKRPRPYSRRPSLKNVLRSDPRKRFQVYGDEGCWNCANFVKLASVRRP